MSTGNNKTELYRSVLECARFSSFKAGHLTSL